MQQQRSLLDPPQDPQNPPDTRDLHKRTYQDHDKHNKFPGGPLLHKAAMMINEQSLRTRSDRSGIICLEYQKFILVARRYIYKDIVSIHETIVQYCIDYDKKIVMYIDEGEQLYLLEPVDIQQKTTAKNNRGGYAEQQMMNFPIDIGELLNKKDGNDADKKTIQEAII